MLGASLFVSTIRPQIDSFCNLLPMTSVSQQVRLRGSVFLVAVFGLLKSFLTSLLFAVVRAGACAPSIQMH